MGCCASSSGAAASKRPEAGSATGDKLDSKPQRMGRGSGSSGEKGSLNDMASRKLLNARESFRHALNGSRFKVNWGVDAHAVNSAWRERRLSDNSLKMVMDDNAIRSGFRGFMHELGETEVFDAWWALDHFDRECSKRREARSSGSVKSDRALVALIVGGGGEVEVAGVGGSKDGKAKSISNSSSSSSGKAGSGDDSGLSLGEGLIGVTGEGEGTGSDVAGSFGKRAGAGKMPDKATLLASAQDIYSTHFRDTAVTDTMLGFLSSSTLNDVRSELLVDDAEVVQQTSLAVIFNVFRVLHLRVHNVLKYEYLPGFLASDHFVALHTADGVARSEDAVAAAILGSSKGDDLFDVYSRARGATEGSLGSSASGATVLERRDSEIIEVLRDPMQSKFFYEFIFQEASTLGSFMWNPSSDDAGREGTHRQVVGSVYRRGSTSHPSGSGGGGDKPDPSAEPASETLGQGEAASVPTGHVSDAAHPPNAPNPTASGGRGPAALRAGRGRRGSSTPRPALRRQSRSLLKQLDIVELNLELDDLLDPSSGPKAVLKRLNLILARYGPKSQQLVDPPVQALQQLYLDLDIASQPLAALPPGNLAQLMEPTRVEVYDMIKQRLIPAFKRSSTFRAMENESRAASPSFESGGGSSRAGSVTNLDAIAEERHSSSGKLRRGKTAPPNTQSSAKAAAVLGTGVINPGGNKRLDGNVRADSAKMATLLTLKEDLTPLGPQHFANQAAGASTISLDQVMDDSYGVLQIKRFARKRFQEENILFLLEIKHLKANNDVHNRAGLYELLHRAQYICDQFLVIRSPLEINISDKQRTETLAHFQACSDRFVRNLNASLTCSAMAAAAPAAGESAGAEPSDELELEEISDSIRTAFDVAYREVHGLVHKELWEEFRDADLFKDYVRKRGTQGSRAAS